MRPRSEAFGCAVWLILLIALFLISILSHRAYGQRFTAQEAALGHQFFFDKRLSLDGTVSCATCHKPELAMTDGLPKAVGIGGQVGQFSTPTIFTGPYQPLQFWDGRTTGIDAQALQPLVNPIEMGNASINQALRRIADVPQYRRAMKDIYGDYRFTQARFARAVTAFQVSASRFNAPIDQRMAGFTRAISSQAERGMAVFRRLGCAACHAPPLFTDGGFHNTGVTWRFLDRDPQTGNVERGRQDVLPPNTRRTSATMRAFKTPTLRGVDRSAPFSHSGAIPTLEAMVEHYARAGARANGDIDPFIDRRVLQIAIARPTREEKADLVAFLREAFSMQDCYKIGKPYQP
jgi:cytochrome c peroxidase